MTNPPRRQRSIKPKLALQLVVILSIAIMPLGLISVFQTNRVLSERQALSKIALLQRTQQAVSGTRAIIQSAISSAETLAVLVKELSPDNGECDALMARVVAENEEFVFAGFSDTKFRLICASQPGELGIDGTQAGLQQAPQPDRRVVMQPLELLGGISTLSVTVPLIEDDGFRGSVWVTIPMSVLEASMRETSENVDLVLFQNDGSLIATGDFGDERRSVLPEDRDLGTLAQGGSASFHARNRDGDVRDFAVSPIVGGRVYVLGSWQPQLRGIALATFEEAAALYFPFVMWLVAIIVAYVGVNRLVIRHVRELRLWMRRYASGDIDLDQARLDNAPEEIEVVAEAFRGMTRRLSEQDKRREDDLKEKTVLLREVHHRVKNNLQLISSILNMQIRATDLPAAKSILRRVQDRVLALSAIHRYIYMSRKLARLRVDELLDQIVEQLVSTVAAGGDKRTIDVIKDFDQVEVTPDQSVPLSLLAAEAAMNALKYCSANGAERPWIRISLKKQEDGQIRLDVENSRTHPAETPDGKPREGSGLGTRLVQSFVVQLEGTLEVTEHPDRHELRVIFPLAPFKHESESEES